MFLQNAQLAGALSLLLAVPLVIHLLNRKFPRRVQFSSVALIRKTMAQRSKLMRWRHWLLTVVRTLMIGCLLLAFLQPMLARFGQPPKIATRRHVVVVVDHSYSMEQPDGLMTLRARAIAEGSRIIDALDSEDNVHVLSAGRNTTASSVGWSTNHAAARAFLTAMGPGYERADLHKTIDAIAGLVRDLKQQPEIYFISDFQRTNWSDASFAELPKDARLFFVAAGDQKNPRENRALIHAEVVSGAVLAGSEVDLVVHVANHTAAVLEEPLEAVIDGRATYEARVEAAPWSVQRVPLAVRAPGPGWHQLVVRLKNPDSLPLDDVFHLPLQVTEKEEVVLLTDDAQAAASALTLRFLEAAINPYADARGSMLPRRVNAAQLLPQDLAATSKVVITRIGALATAQIRTLADYMKAGGGVLYFLDGEHDHTNLAALREWFSQPEAVPLQLIARHDHAGDAEAAQIAKGTFESRYLRLFRGTARESLAQLSFYEHWRATPVERATMLLTYADGTPALALGNPGLGTLLLCNFSVAEIASNIARQRLFPAWIQELVAQLSAETSPAPRHEPGDVMPAEAWLQSVKGLEFAGPSGQPVAASRVEDGERVELLVSAGEPGFYTLAAPRKPPAALLAANIAAAESDLRPLESEIAPKQAQEDAVAGAFGVAAGTDYRELARGQPIFHYFVYAALLGLLMETVLQVTVRRRVA